MKKALKITTISLLSLLVVMILVLFIYTKDSYEPLDEMMEEVALLDLEELEKIDDFDQISYFVNEPKKNIVILPGGKVKPQSYEYLAVQLALSGYDVTIVKTMFNLAILTPKYGARFIKDDIENVVIGHSLGGTVASMFSEGDDRISDLVFLASYPITDVSDKNVLMMIGEFDLVLDNHKLQESENLLPENYISFEILGGNHAQFGWYGVQKDDCIAQITTKAQQDIILANILDFIKG